MRRFIYGAGHNARVLLSDAIMKRSNDFEGVAVTKKEGNPDYLGKLKVLSIDQIVKKYGANIEITVGVSKGYRNEIVELLNGYGIENIIISNLEQLDYKNYNGISEIEYLSEWYFSITGKVLNWKNIKTYNEKIQWIKLHDSTELKRRLVDKYLVRDYISEKVGSQYLIPLLGVWNNFSDVDFSKLPDSFVLKCNHGSGWNEIIYDKNKIDLNSIGMKFTSWLNTDYADTPGLELQYRGVKPVILAEEMLNDSSGDLLDYKFFVFDGKVKLIQVDITRASNHRRNIYTPEWEYVPVSIHYPTAPDIELKKPSCLKRMIEIAETLGEGFIHVRVDLYLVEERIYFGEMTFTHGNGIEKFEPEEFGIKMGNWIKLPYERVRDD